MKHPTPPTMLSSLLSQSDSKQAIKQLEEQIAYTFDSEHPQIFSLPDEIAELEKSLKASSKELERLQKAIAAEPPYIPSKPSNEQENSDE